MWSDIDHMDARQDFTFDPINYPQSEVSNFVQTLHAAGQRYVLIIDPGIRVDNNYSTYTNGMKNDIFIKSSSGSSPYLAQVWPGPVYFPDFLNPNTQSYWTNEISNFQKLAQFDGLWIDMNEASNFCSGVTCTFLSDGSPCPSPDAPTTCCLNCNNSQGSKWDYPPYKINNAASQRDLGGKTIATSAVHYGGILEYDAHNLYGMSEAMVTNRALQSVLQKRPFVLSRSTFVGAGKFTAHWTGDNGATWDDLRYSIVSVLNSGLVGIPMVGADICGFLFDTTEELCNRWIQLGAFYPFARDHSDINSKPQELYLWPSVAQSARKALGLRYRLLPYLYTLVFEAHVTGAPIARALFFSFPNDAQALNINSQFLLGKGIMVSPVLVSNATTVNAYFPQGIWYSLFDYSQLVDAGNGSSQVVSAPWDTINVHVNEGSIIPMQDPASTTSLARKTPFTLVVAFSLQPYSLAAGYLFLDDGESIDMELVDGSSTFVTYNASKSTGGGSLTSNVTYGNFAFNQGLLLQNLVLFGLQAAPASVSINNAPSDSVTIQQISAHAVQISGLKIPVGNIFVVSWST
ncbi:hypothetical protein O6H91_Y189900 [Diphasiastrum complanatum]|nr:hypothetical protein O6H91_Y189900 [Diphasiastrum complanatum]